MGKKKEAMIFSNDDSKKGNGAVFFQGRWKEGEKRRRWGKGKTRSADRCSGGKKKKEEKKPVSILAKERGRK